MNRILILGNSGSGKTTLASRLASKNRLPCLELDLLAWESPGVRRPLDDSLNEIIKFIEGHEGWVMEGCYGSLVQEASCYCTELLFLNPGLETCLANNSVRPWEPQKYDSAEQQDRYFDILQEWTSQYEARDDECSLEFHKKVFEQFKGAKNEYTSLDAYR